MSHGSALGLLLLSAFFWSLGGVLIKSVEWTALGIAGGRSAIAALAIFLFYRRFRFRKSLAQWGGALAYAGTVILFTLANRNTTAANSILLQFTAPVYVALFGRWYLGERTTKLDWFSIMLAFFGMTLFFGGDLSFREVWGNLFAVVSGVSFAWLVLFLRKQKDGSPIESIFLGNALAAVLCLPFSGGTLPNGFSWLLLTALGVVQLAIPYILYSKAIRSVMAIEAITVTFIEPILNPIWVFLILGERPGRLAFLGGAIILSAVALKTFYGRFGDSYLNSKTN